MVKFLSVKVKIAHFWFSLNLEAIKKTVWYLDVLIRRRSPQKFFERRGFL